MNRTDELTDKLVVGYDLDETLADFVGGFNDRVREKFPSVDVINRDEMENYYLSETYGTTVYNRVWDSIQNDRAFYQQLGEISHPAIYDTREIYDRSDTYGLFITARQDPRNVRKQTREWLRSRGFDKPDVWHVDDKAMYVKHLSVDMYLDDRPAHVIEVDQQTETDAYLIDRGYNSSSRVRSVDNVIQFNNLVRHRLGSRES